MVLGIEDMELIVQPQPNDIVLIRIPGPSLSAPTSSCPPRNSGRYTVVFTGIATDIDIETSARHAYALGFIPVIISDAVSSSDKDAHERSLANMRRFFPALTANELAKYWS